MSFCFGSREIVFGSWLILGILEVTGDEFINLFDVSSST